MGEIFGKRASRPSVQEIDELISKRNWDSISRLLLGLPDSLLTYVSDRIEEIIPKREFGDGLETYLDAIEPRHANDLDEYYLACLYNDTIRNLGYRRRGASSLGGEISDFHQPFRSSVNAAINVLVESGICFEGWYSTYLWQHPTTKEWFQVARTDYEAYERQCYDDGRSPLEPKFIAIDEAHEVKFFAKFAELKLEPPEILRVDLDEDNPQLWTTAQPLSMCYHRNLFEPNTPFWHALNILAHYFQEFRSRWDEVVEKNSWRSQGRKDVARSMIATSRAAIAIGRSHEALEKKRFEPHAIRGLKVSRGLNAAANQSNLQHRELRNSRFQRMAMLVPEIGVDSASAQCEAEGLGKWETIKRQWNRHKNRDS